MEDERTFKETIQLCCSCRDDRGERTLSGTLFRDLEKYRRERIDDSPDDVFVDFYKMKGLKRDCCILRLASLFRINLMSTQTSKDLFQSNMDEDDEDDVYMIDISHLEIKPNVELEFPKTK